jgi:hypothetical protein
MHLNPTMRMTLMMPVNPTMHLTLTGTVPAKSDHAPEIQRGTLTPTMHLNSEESRKMLAMPIAMIRMKTTSPPKNATKKVPQRAVSSAAMIHPRKAKNQPKKSMSRAKARKGTQNVLNTIARMMSTMPRESDDEDHSRQIHTAKKRKKSSPKCP